MTMLSAATLAHHAVVARCDNFVAMTAPDGAGQGAVDAYL